MRAMVMMSSMMIVVEIKSSQSRLEFFVFTQVSPKTLCDPSLVTVGKPGCSEQHMCFYCGAVRRSTLLTFPQRQFKADKEILGGFSFSSVKSLYVVKAGALEVLFFTSKALFKSPNQIRQSPWLL
jgi:hypothetical protein